MKSKIAELPPESVVVCRIEPKTLCLTLRLRIEFRIYEMERIFET